MASRAGIIRLLPLAALFACGSSNSAIGPVGGASFNVAEVESAVVAVPACNGANAMNQVLIFISDHPGQCAAAEADTVPPDSTQLELYVISSAAIVPGTYTSSGQPAVARATFVARNSSCDGTSYAATGSITLTSIAGAAVSGSYDLTFDDPAASHLTGSFAGQGCGLTGAELCAEGTTATACQ